MAGEGGTKESTHWKMQCVKKEMIGLFVAVLSCSKDGDPNPSHPREQTDWRLLSTLDTCSKDFC